MSKVYKDKSELIHDVIKQNDVVLDVGFWGQGTKMNDTEWPHRMIKESAKKVVGLDLDFDESALKGTGNYFKANAESFDLGMSFDKIFAGDLIEHLANPGLFLESCRKNLAPKGNLILTTPNCYSLFNLAEKISKFEPTVNKDHTLYLNIKTAKQLLSKCNWRVTKIDFLYALGKDYQESWKKKILNIIYFILSQLTDKYMETIIITAEPIDEVSIKEARTTAF